MSNELKIAQMNTKAVLAKLAAYEATIAEQNGKIARLEAQHGELVRQTEALRSMMAQFATLGSGPTAGR